MTWRVRLFAHLKEQFGPEIEISADPDVTSVLFALHEQGIPVECCRLAADDQFVGLGESLHPGQALALIPPVSGG